VFCHCSSLLVVTIHLPKHPITGTRIFRAADTGKAPGSQLNVLEGHHRLNELYRRYLKGEIDGDTLIVFVKEGLSPYSEVDNCSECTWPRGDQPPVSVGMKESKQQVKERELVLQTWAEFNYRIIEDDLEADITGIEVDYDESTDTLTLTHPYEHKSPKAEKLENTFERAILFGGLKAYTSHEHVLGSSTASGKDIVTNGNIFLTHNEMLLKLDKHKDYIDLFTKRQRFPFGIDKYKSMFSENIPSEHIIDAVINTVVNSKLSLDPGSNARVFGKMVDFGYPYDAEFRVELNADSSGNIYITTFIPIKGKHTYGLEMIGDPFPENSDEGKGLLKEFGTGFYLAQDTKKVPIRS
jgi:hypothetical protein